MDLFVGINGLIAFLLSVWFKIYDGKHGRYFEESKKNDKLFD